MGVAVSVCTRSGCSWRSQPTSRETPRRPPKGSAAASPRSTHSSRVPSTAAPAARPRAPRERIGRDLARVRIAPRSRRRLLAALLARAGHDILLLYVVISADNLTAGLASAAFIAFLSSLTNVRFTAVQYAVFSSLMTLPGQFIGGFSGVVVDAIGYASFFVYAACAGLPAIGLVIYSRN